MMDCDNQLQQQQQQRPESSGNTRRSLRRRHIRFPPKLVTKTQVIEHWSQYSPKEWNSIWMNEEEEEMMEEHTTAWLYSGEKEIEEARQAKVNQQIQRELRYKQRRNNARV